MYAIKVNDDFLELSPGESITLQGNNPLFDSENLNRTFSYSFKIPTSHKNISLLGYANRLDVPVGREFTAKLFFGKLVFETGIIKITGSSRESISLIFQNEPINQIKNFGKLKLPNVSMPVEVTTYNPTYQIFGQQDASQTDIVLEVDGTVLTRPILDRDLLVDDINALRPGTAVLIDSGVIALRYYITIAITPPDTGDPVVLRFRPDGYDEIQYTAFIFDLTYAPVGASDVKTAVLAHMKTACTSGTTHVFPTIEAANLYDGQNALWNRYANWYFSDAFEGNDADSSIQFENTAIPMPYATYVADQVLSAFGMVKEGEFWDDTEIQKLIFSNLVTIDYLADPNVYILDYDGFYDYFNTYKPSFDLADHLPEITVRDFLRLLADNFCLNVSVRNNRVIMTFKKSALTAPLRDWTKYAIENPELSYTDATEYELIYNRDDDEASVAGQLEDVLASGELDFQSYTSGFFTNPFKKFIRFLRTYLFPFSNLVGTSAVFTLENKVHPKLLFYRGFQKNSDDEDYPLATHGTVDQAGNTVGNYSLDWSGSNGLYEKFWKEFIALQASQKTITCFFNLPVQEIINLNTWEHPRIQIKYPNGTFTGIIKSFSVKATTNQLGLVRCEVVELTN